MRVAREFPVILILLRFCGTEFQTDTSPEDAEYEPLYVVEKSGRYTFVDSIEFDSTSKKYVLLAPNGFDIEVACPKRDADGVLLETVGQPVTARFPLGVLCDNPVQIYIEPFPNSNKYYSVGFLMYKEGADFTDKNINNYLPPTHNALRLMIVNFDPTEALPASVWHSIDTGEWIQIECSEPANNTEYEKNLDIIGFDVDEGYSLKNQRHIFDLNFNEPLPCALRKIQLAPAEDFFLSNFKKISRINMNTAPIWERSLPQWRSLEKFVRKVARVLRKLTIVTGTADLQLFPAAKGGTEALHLHTATQKLTVPQYFWKAVISHYGPSNDPDRNFGIIFIMLNDPYFGIRKRKIRRLCDGNVIKKTGWDYHAQTDVVQSEIYACPLTQHIFTILQGGMLPISEYEMLNLNEARRLYHDGSGNKKIEIISVLKELKRRGLL